MSELEQVRSVVSQVARRRKWQRAGNGFWLGFLTGVILWSLLLISYKFLPIPVSILGVGAIVALACPILGLLLAALQRRPLLETARWLDRKVALADRLTTALELSGSSKA